jgi:hypothetical protein
MPEVMAAAACRAEAAAVSAVGVVEAVVAPEAAGAEEVADEPGFESKAFFFVPYEKSKQHLSSFDAQAYFPSGREVRTRRGGIVTSDGVG